MNCTCIKDTCAKLQEKLAEAPPSMKPHKLAVLRRVEYSGEGLGITAELGLTAVYTIDFIGKWTLPNGNFRDKPVAMQMSFCPLCGVKF